MLHFVLALFTSAQSVQPDTSVLAVEIPSGSFMMGCVPGDQQCEPTEFPRREVTLTRPFWLARTETTVGQFHKFVTATNFRTESDKRGQGRFWRFDINEWDWVDGLSWRAPFAADQPAPDNWPAVQIAWSDADAYCRWAGGRLPTEAEWERAARGGTEGQTSVWGNAPSPMVDGVAHANAPDLATAREFSTFSTFADYNDGFARLAPVASFAPNAYGLHDMAGNVYEWTSDWIIDGPYPSGPVTDPRGVEAGEIKAVRGAGWGYPPEQFRISFRGIAGLDFWTATFGFRCAWDRNPNSLFQGR
jgi:formylglycine-generating enzyme required for sulfatase activity